MSLRYLVTAAAVATLAATAAQAQTQTQPSPQPGQKTQHGNSVTAPNAKHGASGTVGSSSHSKAKTGAKTGRTVKPAPEGTMEHDAPATDSDTD
ncbi:MAG: hypothetical protein WBA29_04825 [Xanthobacteraceae bacterium]